MKGDLTAKERRLDDSWARIYQKQKDLEAEYDEVDIWESESARETRLAAIEKVREQLKAVEAKITAAKRT
ncbi:MAG: hypothetical protein Q8R78_02530 [Candidatus Omnitrophota bacterium]|nr:hypothetical protein [Candidatus Omnitrophota bacterium]